MYADPPHRRPSPAGLLLLVILLFPACSTAPPILPPIDVNGPRDLIHRIMAQTDSLENARVRSRVSIEIDGVRQKATSIVFFDRPSDLKMEVNGSLGISVMSAKFRGDSLSVYLPGDNGYLEGPAARVLYQVTGMNLGLYDIQRVILGIPTLSTADVDRTTGFDTTDDHYLLDLYDGVLRKRLWVDRRQLTVVREDILDGRGDLLSRLKLDSYKVEAGCLLPTRIEISQGTNHIIWSTESLRINQGVDPSVFELILPPGLTRLNS